MKINIDGKEIEAKEGMTILDAAIEAGVYIPHLCKHPDLEAVGGCRLCSVEIEGIEDPVLSCMTQVDEGMNININGSKADETRKMAMELILASHPADCTGCPKYGKCELQSLYQYMGVGPERWRKKARVVPTDETNPLISHLFTRCIRCGRCVRACRELRGAKVLDFQKTCEGIQIGTDGGVSLKEAGCMFCGACIEVCPTGSIMDTLGIIKEDKSYAESVVPCRSTCPAEIDIPRYIRYIKQGNFSKATAVVREKVPFPETLGSICEHLCESECKRNKLGTPISVCKLKRAAAVNDDGAWKEKSKKEEPTGKNVAIIGAGPAGLTAAYYLEKKGHEVTIFEANEKAGGQCRYGIPAYRLSDETLDMEVADILEVGIDLRLNTSIKSPSDLLEQGYDTVLVAVGTHEGSMIPIPGANLKGVLVNTTFLKQARMGTIESLGEKVMVLGGGNVAYDCARTAIRLGAKEVHITCLEEPEKMPASTDEIEEGAEEGIFLHAGCSFLSITGTEQVEGVELQTVDKFYLDDNGKAVVELVEGTKEVVPVDTVIFAVGQKPQGTQEMGLELARGLYIDVDYNLQTSMPGVYAAGDVVTGTKSVIEAIAAGRRSAKEMDRYLGGDGIIAEELIEKEIPNPRIGRTEGILDLGRIAPKIQDAELRKQSFDCVELAYTCEEAQHEASRCLQCDLRLNITKPKLWNEY